MKKLREQFEKEHPIPAKLTNLPNERHFSPKYVEWLENRNAEKDNALRAVYKELESLEDWGEEISTSTIEKVIKSLYGKTKKSRMS